MVGVYDKALAAITCLVWVVYFFVSYNLPPDDSLSLRAVHGLRYLPGKCTDSDYSEAEDNKSWLPPGGCNYPLTANGRDGAPDGIWFDGYVDRTVPIGVRENRVDADEKPLFVITEGKRSQFRGASPSGDWMKMLHLVNEMVSSECSRADSSAYCEIRREFGTSQKEKLSGHTVTILTREMAGQRGFLEALYVLMHGGEEMGSLNVLSRLRDKLRVRQAEYITYQGPEHRTGPQREAPNGLGWHHDDGAYISMSLMLSHPHEYEGGETKA